MLPAAQDFDSPRPTAETIDYFMNHHFLNAEGGGGAGDVRASICNRTFSLNQTAKKKRNNTTGRTELAACSTRRKFVPSRRAVNMMSHAYRVLASGPTLLFRPGTRLSCPPQARAVAKGQTTQAVTTLYLPPPRARTETRGHLAQEGIGNKIQQSRSFARKRTKVDLSSTPSTKKSREVANKLPR